MNGRRMRSLAIAMVFAGMALSVSGHAGWAPQKAQTVSSMSSLELPALKKSITKRFANAKLSEVLAWLSLEQFSFVADASEFTQEAAVTLNFRNQPLGAVLDAIADAFNGRWERRGDIFNLRPAASSSLFSAGRAMPALPAAEAIPAPLTAPIPPAGLGGRAAAPATGTPPPAFGPLGGTLRTPGAPTVAEPSTEGLTAPRIAQQVVRAGSAAPVVTAPPAPPAPLAPMLQGARVADTVRVAIPAPPAPPEAPLFRGGTIATTVAPAAQDEQARQQAMQEVERALKAAEEQMRKLHESGEWRRAMEKAMSEARSAQGQEHEKATAEMRRALEEAMKAMQNLPHSEQWKRAWSQAREKMQKALREGKFFEGGKERKMTEKERAALEKSLKSIDSIKVPEFKMPNLDRALVMPKLEMKGFAMPKIDSKVFPSPEAFKRAFTLPDDPKFKGRQEAIEKAIEEMNRRMKDMKDPEGRAFTMPKMEGRAFTVPRFKVEDLPKIKELDLANPRVFDSRRMQIDELLNSLTEAQKQKQDKQGYLTLSDLTPKQRAMLGSIPESGNWTFSYSIDGKKLTIKNK